MHFLRKTIYECTIEIQRSQGLKKYLIVIQLHNKLNNY